MIQMKHSGQNQATYYDYAKQKKTVNQATKLTQCSNTTVLTQLIKVNVGNDWYGMARNVVMTADECRASYRNCKHRLWS